MPVLLITNNVTLGKDYSLLRIHFLIYEIQIIAFTNWVPRMCQAQYEVPVIKELVFWNCIFQAFVTTVC